MSVYWLVPAAVAGLALLAVPLLIHLLAQYRSERLLFPSLRFLPTSQLAALSRHRIADWPLLVIRLLIVVAAVGAAAAPVFVSDATRAAWQTRVARALVLAHDAAEVTALADHEARTSFTSARFAQPRLADAIRSAANWLDEQPPAAREIVVIGDVRAGAIAAADLEVLQPHIGVRFLPLQDTDLTPLALRAVADAGNGIEFTRLGVHPDETGTVAKYEVSQDEVSSRIEVLADAEHQALADALLRAVMREGFTYDPTLSRAVSFVFAGAEYRSQENPPSMAWMREVLQQHPQVRGSEQSGRLIVQTELDPTDPQAPALLASVLSSALSPSLESHEPRSIATTTLMAWSRPPGGFPADIPPADEGDRRWFWGMALALLGVEQLVRRRIRDV